MSWRGWAYLFLLVFAAEFAVVTLSVRLTAPPDDIVPSVETLLRHRVSQLEEDLRACRTGRVDPAGAP